MRNSKAVVCLSGGADSATILYLAVAECSEVHAISVNYGQRHIKELDCAKALCEELNIKHTIVDFKVLASFGGSPLVDSSIDVPTQAEGKQATTVVPYRNIFLTTIAAAYCEQHELNTIYVGPTHEDLANYPDCLLPGSFIETPEGVLSIEEIAAGDKVLTERGYNTVSEAFTQEYKGIVVKVCPKGLPVRFYTQNHPLIVWRKNNLIQVLAKDLSIADKLYYPRVNIKKDIEQINVQDICPELQYNSLTDMCYFKNKGEGEIPSQIKITEKFLRLLGFYISEGCAVNQKNGSSHLSFGFHEKEIDYITEVKTTLKEVFGKDSRQQIHTNAPDNKGYELVCNSIALVNLFKSLSGKYARNKKIPEFCMYLPIEKQRALLSGIFDGDLFYKELKLSVSSPHLVYQIRQLLLQQNVRSTIQHIMTNLSKRPLYILHILKSDYIKDTIKRGKPSSTFVPDGLAIDIYQIKQQFYSGTVYSLEVENTHTFVNEGILVHNCRPSYIESIQRTLRLGGTIHDIEVRAPFISSTKDWIVQFGTERLSVSYDKTYTCYKGGEVPCMECDSCRERALSFYLNGYKDPIVPDEIWNKYCKEMDSKDIERNILVLAQTKVPKHETIIIDNKNEENK